MLGIALDVVALEPLGQQVFCPPSVGEVLDRWSITVALDGKTMRGTIPRGHSRGVHLLAADAPAQGIVLFQVAVDTKEHELMAACWVARGSRMWPKLSELSPIIGIASRTR